MKWGTWGPLTPWIPWIPVSPCRESKTIWTVVVSRNIYSPETDLPVMRKCYLASWFSGFTHMPLWYEEELCCTSISYKKMVFVENHILGHLRTYSRSWWANKSRSSWLPCRTFVTSRALGDRTLRKLNWRIALCFIWERCSRHLNCQHCVFPVNIMTYSLSWETHFSSGPEEPFLPL